jgi:hypothetical protein
MTAGARAVHIYTLNTCVEPYAKLGRAAAAGSSSRQTTDSWILTAVGASGSLKNYFIISTVGAESRLTDLSDVLKHRVTNLYK